MTITAEPPFRTLPQYRHQPLHTPDSPLTSRLSVVGTMHDRFEEILTKGRWTSSADYTASSPVGGPNCWRSGTAAKATVSLSDRNGRDPRGSGMASRAARSRARGPPLRDHRTANAKMTIGALNSGARVWMADFEDATSPTWFNIIDGQLNLYDAIRRQIDFTDADGRRHELSREPATIMVRPRGWHLTENHLVMDGQPIPAAFVDFGLFFFHNAQTLISNGRGPYFYLPKLESHAEARLWHDVFAWSEEVLGIPHGTIRATCLIETLPAAFEMTEILYELREYSAGLNAGRWDYIFSFIKNFAGDPSRVTSGPDAITMTVPFMRAYTELLVKTCHERAPTPSAAWQRSCPAAPTRRRHPSPLNAPEPTRHGGRRWLRRFLGGHPGLVPICTEVFSSVLGIGRTRSSAAATTWRSPPSN